MSSARFRAAARSEYDEALKGVQNLDRLLAEREEQPFLSLRDFTTRVPAEEREVTNLILAGAFDAFDLPRPGDPDWPDDERMAAVLNAGNDGIAQTLDQPLATFRRSRASATAAPSFSSTPTPWRSSGRGSWRSGGGGGGGGGGRGGAGSCCGLGLGC